MKKTLITRIVFVVGIILLLILQYIWTYNMYESVSKSLVDNSISSFEFSIDQELLMRDKPIKCLIADSTTQYEKATESSGSKELRNPSDLTFLMNDFLSKCGKCLDVNRLDSIYCYKIKESVGFIPTHRFIIVSNKKRLNILKNRKELISRFDQQNMIDIVIKCGTKQWIQLSLSNPRGDILKKANLLFLSSIIIVLIIAVIIIIQFRNMQHDRKFVKFLVDYTRMLAHDLRTPVTGVRMLVSKVGKDHSLPEESKQMMLDQSVELTDKVLMNLDILLYLAKSEHVVIPVNKLPLNLNMLIDSLVAGYKTRDFAPKQVLITYSVPEDTKVLLDKVLMENILINLLDNSIKYSGLDTKINIKVELNSGNLTIEVSDNGYGISKENQKHIFEIFERGAATENPTLPGFGLGLHFVQKAVQAHKGRVELKSEMGVGTLFTITLPVE